MKTILPKNVWTVIDNRLVKMWVSHKETIPSEFGDGETEYYAVWHEPVKRNQLKDKSKILVAVDSCLIKKAKNE